MNTPDPFRARQRALLEQIAHGASADASLVPLTAEHARGRERCLTTVAFPPHDVLDHLEARVLRPLRRALPDHYHYPHASLHLTLKNVRTVHDPARFDAATVAAANTAIAPVLAHAARPRFFLRELFLFPTSAVVAAYAEPAFTDLVLELDRALDAAGLPDDKGYVSRELFFGNITICRFVRPLDASARAAVAALDLRAAIEMAPATATLLSCNAVCHPSTLVRHHVMPFMH